MKSRWIRLLPLAALLALLTAGATFLPAAADEGKDSAAARADALRASYEKLLAHRDNTSFMQRMSVLRALGEIDHARSREFLLNVVRRSKLLDDKAVAVMALGAHLDAATARNLADLVARRPRAVLVQALGDAFAGTTSAEVLTWLATDALQHKSTAVLQAALDAQYIHGDARCEKRARELYAIYSPKRAGMAIAHAVVRALGAINGPGVRSFLIAAVGHEDWRVRLAAADVMAWQRPDDVNIRGALRRLLVDDEPVIRQRVAASIGTVKLTELLPDVAARLDDPHIRTRAVAHDALAEMTGKDLGYGRDDWMRWFDRQDETTERLKPSPSKSTVTYYGVNVRSDRLLFIVDISGSMAMPRGNKTTRMDVARSELTRVLKHLDPNTLFNVIVFSDKVKSWRRGETLARKDNVARALRWIDRTLEEPQGGTFMHAALERAFAENPAMDTVCLLTDGLATDGEPIVPEAILASVNGWNRYRRVAIHTFALTLEKDEPNAVSTEDLTAIKGFMRQLSKATGGTCTVIDKAPPNLLFPVKRKDAKTRKTKK